jgi:hypothetical protein
VPATQWLSEGKTVGPTVKGLTLRVGIFSLCNFYHFPDIAVKGQISGHDKNTPIGRNQIAKSSR